MTQAAANLTSEAKSRARTEPDAKRRGQIIKGAQALIVAASKLAQAASAPQGQGIEQAARGVSEKALEVEEAMRSGKKEVDQVPPAIAEQLVTATRAVALATDRKSTRLNSSN